MRCGSCETPQHYLHCTKNPKPDEINRCVNSIAKWMTKAGTSQPLKIIIITAIREWLKEGKLEVDWNIPQDEDHAGLTQALVEKEQIRWHNFFKGRISQTWTDIQQSEYSKQSQHRIDNNDDPLPKHCSGNWWASNLIKQVVFMSLNLWQSRNDTLHADKIMPDYNTQRRLLQTQTATWYDRENEFEDDDRKHFHRPYLERLTDPNHLLQAWCVIMERLQSM